MRKIRIRRDFSVDSEWYWIHTIMTKIRIRHDFSVDSEWYWINNNEKNKN